MSASTATGASDFPVSTLAYYQDIVNKGSDPQRTDGLVWNPERTASVKTNKVEEVYFLAPDYDFTVGVRGRTSTTSSTLNTKFDIGTAYAITQSMKQEADQILKNPETFRDTEDVVSTLTKRAVNRAFTMQAPKDRIDQEIMRKAHKGSWFSLDDLSFDWLNEREFTTQASYVSDLQAASVKLSWVPSILESCFDHPQHRSTATIETAEGDDKGSDPGKNLLSPVEGEFAPLDKTLTPTHPDAAEGFGPWQSRPEE